MLNYFSSFYNRSLYLECKTYVKGSKWSFRQDSQNRWPQDEICTGFLKGNPHRPQSRFSFTGLQKFASIPGIFGLRSSLSRPQNPQGFNPNCRPYLILSFCKVFNVSLYGEMLFKSTKILLLQRNADEVCMLEQL